MTDRNKYRRKRLFGYILLAMVALNILSVGLILYVLSNNPDGATYSSRLARQVVWLFIGTSIGWNWLRLIWTPYEKIQSETDAPEGLGQAMGKWKEAISTKISNTFSDPNQPLRTAYSEKRKLKPYEYPPPSPTEEKPKTAKTANSNEEDEEATIKNLEKYRRMYEKGLISEDEYGRLKSKELGI